MGIPSVIETRRSAELTQHRVIATGECAIMTHYLRHYGASMRHNGASLHQNDECTR